MGKLPDGRTVIARPTSGSIENIGPPTLEIQQGKKRVKIRYE